MKNWSKLLFVVFLDSLNVFFFKKARKKYSLVLNIYFKILTPTFYLSAPFLSQSISYNGVIFLIVERKMTFILCVFMLGSKA